MKRKRKEIHW